MGRIKQYFWEHFFGKSIKDLVLLIFLAFATKNFSDFQDFPLNSMIRKIQGVLSISSSQINYKDAGYYLFMYTLQNLPRINSITDVLTSMQEQAKMLNFKDFDK